MIHNFIAMPACRMCYLRVTHSCAFKNGLPSHPFPPTTIQYYIMISISPVTHQPSAAQPISQSPDKHSVFSSSYKAKEHLIILVSLFLKFQTVIFFVWRFIEMKLSSCFQLLLPSLLLSFKPSWDLDI